MRKSVKIANFVVICAVIILLAVTISARNLNIRSAIITSVEYSIGNEEWYTYDELKAKMWNITNVYIRVRCDLESSEALTYDFVDCFINAEGYEDYIACYGNINKENNTIVITTKNALDKNFGYGYLRIGDPDNSTSVLLGETLELDLIKNWSGVDQEVTINVQYGVGENGPWKDREIEVLDDVLETEVLHEIYVKVQATTNVGNMKSVVIIQNENEVASGVCEVVYKVKSNTKEFKIVAESESRISKEQTFGISNLGEQGKKEKEFVKIEIQYGLNEDGPWYNKQSEVLEDILEDEILEKIYVKASATTNIGNISSIKISQKQKELLTGIDSLVYEVKNNTTENTLLKVEANSESGETGEYIFSIYSIGEIGKKEKRDITISVQYGLNGDGPWYDDESVVLNDISADQKIDMIYVKAQAKVDKGNVRKVAILQNDEELNQELNDVVVVSGVTRNTTNETKFYIKAESDNGIEETMDLNITKIGSYGIKSEEKISIGVEYSINEEGPWYRNQKDIMSDVLENEKVDKIYMKVEATTDSGTITNITIKDSSKVINSKSAGIVIQEFNKNSKEVNIIVKSNRNVVMSCSVEISHIGEVGIREDIEVLIKYAIAKDGIWYDTESELLVKEKASQKEYIKINAKSNKKDIQSVEIKKGDTSLAYSNTGDLIHYFEENMGGVIVVVTSGSGEVVSQNIEISGIEKNEVYIKVEVKYGINNNGPWRSREEDILTDVKNTEKINEVYIKAIGEVDKGNIFGIEIRDGESTRKESSSTVIHKFSKNTNEISVIATDNYGNKGMWTGSISKIGSYGIKNGVEDGNDSLIQDITEDFSKVDWDIRKNIDWRKDLVSEMELKIKDEYTNVPDIIVSKVGGKTDVAMVSLKSVHDGEEGYNIRYRLGNKEEDKSIEEAVMGEWQEYSGPFMVSTNTYVEAEGRFNEDNPSYMTAMQIIDIEEINSAMYIMDDKNMPLTSNKQYYIAYYENASSLKKYKKGTGSWVSLGGGNMFVIEVDGGSNTIITLKEEIDGVEQESIAYVVDNGITMSCEKISTENEEQEGRYKYRVKLEPGEKITDATIKEVGIMGEYTLDGVVNGIVRKTNTIIDKNGIFEFEIKNAPSDLTCKAYYVNEENEMVVK